jgi:methionyl-tRNA formyltransferase
MLNILLITQDDPFYVPIFFKELLKENFSPKFNLKGIIIQKPLGKKTISKLIRQMLDFYGSKNFLVIGIKFIIYKLLNLLAVNIFKGKFPGIFSVEHIILKNDINKIQIGNINSPESIAFLRTLDIDVVFSIAASQILRKNILELPKLGCFNIHTSRLPKNRGMMPNFWSLYNYDKEPVSAVTIHKMNEKLDDGDILIQTEFDLNPNESLDSLIKRTKKLSASTFLKAIDLLNNQPISLKTNDAIKASYNSFPKREDVLRFKQKGLKLR